MLYRLSYAITWVMAAGFEPATPCIKSCSSICIRGKPPPLWRDKKGQTLPATDKAGQAQM
ncbi:MAG: hypothetical protein E6Q92_06465 [Burkholderiaceae bacterium]|nr:MAG: hypothetical protein E6Q92_06465 [Burkholderiaceae bacterium]